MKRVAIAMTLLSLVLAAATQALGNQIPPRAQSCTATDEVPAHPAAATKVVRLRIPGMSAPNCPLIVKAAVSRINGVTRVDADLETKSATVEFTEGSTTVKAIQAVIKERTGYDTELLP